MSTNFEFNAPQFINFSDMDDSKADRFFDVNPQQELGSSDIHVTKVKETPLAIQPDRENQDPSSTVKNSDLPSCKKNFTNLRRVLHEIVNHPAQADTAPAASTKDQEKDLLENFGKLQLSETKQRKSRLPVKATEVFSGIKCRGSEKKCHQMITRLDAMNQKEEKISTMQCLNSQQIEKASEHEVSSTTNNIMKSIKRNASPLHSAKKFISLAEQVEHFYKDTPDRYRSRPTKPTMPTQRNWVARQTCIPKTPKLTTKYRQRKVNFPDEKQREEMELEEIKKHQIKALPLNEKILLGPCLNLKAPIIKKPTTIPQPFSLTEVKAKEPPPKQVFHFKAQPVPTNILQGPVGIPPKKVTTPTIPTTPLIRVPLRFRAEVKSEEKSISNESLTLPRNTKIEPFSFDARMKEILQKKEDFVKKVIEEEKKGFSSFKAHPMPSFKDQTPKVEKTLQKTVPQPFNLTQPKGNKSFAEEQNAQRVTPFKAKPAAVVHQKPFIPKLQKHEVLPSNFHLNTEKRAFERQKFDEKIKQKEEENALICKLQKEEEERLEREKKLEERKKTEFKATPMPRYKVFEIHASDPEKLTLPQSPMSFSKLREQKKGKL